MFYDVLSLTRWRRCSCLIRYGILYDIQSQHEDNSTALAKFALSECQGFCTVVDEIKKSSQDAFLRLNRKVVVFILNVGPYLLVHSVYASRFC